MRTQQRPSYASPRYLLAVACTLLSVSTPLEAQVTTTGFLNQARDEAPGTLLSHPEANDSEAIGRTTSLNYLNGWLIVGGEAPGSRPGSDLELRVYDISDPENPVRRRPSDFNLDYENNRWHQGNYGWNAHGTAQSGDLLLPTVLRVSEFSGPVERGGTNGIPTLGQLPLWYNRSSQAGPWNATLQWYGSPEDIFTLNEVYLNDGGWVQRRELASFDHIGPYGGGDWHPMIFGDLLIYARSGTSGKDGVVVYRMQFNDFEDPETRSVNLQFVGSLQGGFEGYWPTLFSDGSGLYVVGSTTDILIAADITQAADPAGDGSVTTVASLTVPQFSNASYPTYQDNYGFIHNRKIDMTRFLAGDPNPIVLALEESAPNYVNTSQMSLPLGNLWITGGYPIGYGSDDYRRQGMAVWVHQQAPDTTAPRVSYHIPQAGRSNYPRFAPLSFLVHEHTRAGGPRNGIDFTVRPVLAGDTLGDPVDGFLIHDFSGVLTFTPENGLAAETTYQVDFLSDTSDPDNLIGFIDAAGNAIEAYSYRFSTGGGLEAPLAPSIAAFTADDPQPEPDQTITFQLEATGEAPFEYRFNFDGSWSDWSTSPTATHSYPETSRQRALAQVRDANGQTVTASKNILVIEPPPTPQPTQSSALAIGDDPAGRRLWVVNPDANTVSVLDPATGEKLAEHPVGLNPRSIARDAYGRYWVTCHQSDEIRVLDTSGNTLHTLALPYGSAPFGIAPSPDGQSLFVTLYGSAEILRYAAANPTAIPTANDTFPTPRSIAVSGDGSRVLVTRFISEALQAQVAEFAGASPNLDHVRTFQLRYANPSDGGDRASGVPNYLASITISPDGSQAAIASKQDNVQRGVLYGVPDLTHESTSRAVVSFLDLEANAEQPNTRRDIDNSDSPSAIAYSPLGDTLFVSLQGNNRIIGMDTLSLTQGTDSATTGTTVTAPAIISVKVSTDLAPQGILFDASSGRLFAQNFMGRSVTVRDATPFLDQNLSSFPLIATTGTVAEELLDDDILLGKQIFYNADDTRMSAEGYISCATCHVDGGSDGRVWDFTGRGEGLRRTTDLRGRSGLGHGNVHWSANFDEIQDFEHDIRGPFGGEGFLPIDRDTFAELHPSPASGKAGLSEELDALAAYIASLDPSHTPRSPHRNTDGTFTDSALRGRDVFVAQSCNDCHSGDSLTDSQVAAIANANLQDVGTTSRLSGTRLADTLTGIDTPTLHGLHATQEYLHHGQAATLEDVFTYAGGQLFSATEGAPIFTADESAIATSFDDPSQGGGGFQRGSIDGSFVTLRSEQGTNEPTGLSFSNLDGGTTGGTARLSIRYLKNYSGGTLLLNVNGSQQSLDVYRQYPDYGWMAGGWRWVNVEVALEPGPNNTVEILRGNNDTTIDALLLANSDVLATADPHRRVTTLSGADQADLMQYLRQLDGRDAAGQALPAPEKPEPEAPTIITQPTGGTLAVGNDFTLFISVSGQGPFTYQWSFNGEPLPDSNTASLELPSLELSHAGEYSATVSNSVGQATSSAATLVVNPSLAVTTSTLPTATAGVPYETALAASGGIDARTWSLVLGTLPPGMSLDTQGILSGTPNAPGRSEIRIRVSDSSGQHDVDFDFAVRPADGWITDSGLLLHYTFDEGSGDRVWDSSFGGNDHSTDVPGATWIADGRFGGAYGVAGATSSVADFAPANQSDLDFDPRADEFTISLWLRTNSDANYRTVLSKDTRTPSNNVQYRLWFTNGREQLQAITANQYGTQLNTSALTDGGWHLLTMVNFHNGETWRTRLYLDGGQTYAEFATGTAGTVDDLLRIGETSNGGNPIAGQLDDLRIYDRALTPEQIDLLFEPPASATFDTWIASLSQQPPAEQRHRTDDPDGDGLSNLAEYALGGDPMAYNPIDGFSVELSGEQLLVHYPVFRAGILYTVQRATSLDNPVWTTQGVTQDTTSLVGQIATAVVPISETAFVRLVITD